MGFLRKKEVLIQAGIQQAGGEHLALQREVDDIAFASLAVTSPESYPSFIP